MQTLLNISLIYHLPLIALFHDQNLAHIPQGNGHNPTSKRGLNRARRPYNKTVLTGIHIIMSYCQK